MSRKEPFRRVIWGNRNLDFERDWRKDLQEEHPEMSVDELMRLMFEINAEYLEDERVNLNIQLSQPILVIAELECWNGNFDGYKEVKSGKISDCLYTDTDLREWYIDNRGDLRADAIHHDGTNHYLYRVYKDSATEAQINNLKLKIYEGRATRADITRVTRRLGDDIARVYGFSIPGRKFNS